jgi:hypothetical protein
MWLLRLQTMGLKVVLLDQGPAGGTCLNNGCIPFKMQYQDLMPVIKSQVIHDPPPSAVSILPLIQRPFDRSCI